MRALPKYKQLAQHLREAISQGIYQKGDALPTEWELSQAHGVSRQTVRQALSVLEDYGLIMSRQGSGTYVTALPQAKKDSKTVGVITTYISDYIFPSIVRGIEATLSQENVTMSLAATYNQVDYEHRILTKCLATPYDGLIIEGTKTALSNPNISLYKELSQRNIPFVFINGYYPQLEGAVHVVMDDRAGGYQAAEHLIRHGHKRIAGIFKRDDMQGHLRYAGFTQALLDYGLALYNEDIAWFTTESKEAVVQKQDGFPPMTDCTGLVCYNDEIAFSVQSFIKQQGKEGEISIISFDNSVYAQFADPRLTSFNHAKEQLGIEAAKKLITMIHGQKEKSTSLPWRIQAGGTVLTRKDEHTCE